MSDSIFQLAYASSATGELSVEQLERLLAQARTRNQALNITGMLLYAEGVFLQVLEGPQDRVRGLYKRICQDERHARIFLVHEGEVGQRSFPDWRMGFRLLDTQHLSQQDAFSDLLQPGSSLRERMQDRPDLAHRLLLAFSECSGVLPDLEQLARDS